MRMARSQGLGLGAWTAIGALVLVVLAAAGLAVYGGMVRPAQHQIVQVLSNDRFAD